jgi:hypothetical protein
MLIMNSTNLQGQSKTAYKRHQADIEKLLVVLKEPRVIDSSAQHNRIV